MMVMPNLIPCKDCPRKGCGAYHDQCEKYAEYKNKISMAHTIKNKDMEITNYLLNSRKRRSRE